MAMSATIDHIALLAACALFKGASEDDIRALSAVATPASWRSGSTIFQQGDAAEFLVIINSGRIRLSLATASGKELTIRHAAAGTALGEIGVLDHEPRSADATADSDTTALVIRRAAFMRLLTERPGLALAVIGFLTSRLRETTYQLESVALYELAARLARFLLATLRQGHGEHLPPRATLKLELGQGEIASILGASRPKLNRALADLEEQGAIRREGRNLECMIDRLTEIAAADED